MVWEFAMGTAELGRAEFLDVLTRRANEGHRGQVVWAESGQGKTQLALDFAARTDAVFVQASRAVDRCPDLVLSVARALGAPEPASILRARNDDLGGALSALDRALGGRALVVDDADLLGRPEPDRWGLGILAEDAVTPTLAWLRRSAAMMTASRWREGQSLPPVEDLTRRTLREAAAYLEGRPSVDHDDEVPAYLNRVYEACPDEARRALAVVALHGGALDTEIVDGLSSRSARELLVQLRLLRDWAGRLVVQPLWRSWVSSTHPEVAPEIHLELAKAFAARVAEGDDRTAVEVLHAHRHYVAAGDPVGAAHLARYSVLPLLQAARALSMGGRYAEAAELYGIVGQHSPELIGERAAGYAKHYFHYNRAKLGAELLSDTERGYSEALRHWPENALFWSRLALTRFHQNRVAAGERTLDEARARVPEHPEKETVLRSRTVKRLVRRGAIVQALRVWGEHHPTNQRDRDALDSLLRECARGWRTSRIEARDVPPTLLRREVEVRIEASAGAYLCDIPQLEVSGRGPTPSAALETTARSLRDEVRRLIRAFAHALAPAERLRKGVILGLVDPVASSLLEGVDASAWVYGRLVEDQGTQWLEAAEGERYEVPAALRGPADPRPRFALVKTGDAGEPKGPILRLEAAASDDPDRVLAAWAERVARGTA